MNGTEQDTGANWRGRVRVSAGARLHFGFSNLSLAHRRLYAGIGLSLARPGVVVEAEPAAELDAPELVANAARRAAETLDVPGARVRVREHIDRHVGLGSGTQHALATYAAIARAHGLEPAVRETAPELGRGGRSGVGVAAFLDGGFVVDAGHPTAQFTTARPADGEWTVPPVISRHTLPENWRVLVVVPDAEPGRSGEDEDRTMRSVIEEANPDVSDRIATSMVRELLPAAAEGDRRAFAEAAARISRLNGAWYADRQGGVFRPPVGQLVDALDDHDAVDGAGQSSWGPAAFGITGAAREAAARKAGLTALDAADADGQVHVVELDREGARIERV